MSIRITHYTQPDDEKEDDLQIEKEKHSVLLNEGKQGPNCHRIFHKKVRTIFRFEVPILYFIQL